MIANIRLKVFLVLISWLVIGIIAIPDQCFAAQKHVQAKDTGSKQIIVSSTQWVNTGITVNGSNTLNISATGSWSASEDSGFTTPDGYAQEKADNFLNLKDIGSCTFCASTKAPHWGALIGYIGNNPPVAGSYTSGSIISEAEKVFFIGSNFQSTPKFAGTLWLTFNDDAYSGYISDNSGQVTATVTVTPTPGPAGCPGSRQKLFVLVQGISTTLSNTQAAQGQIPDTFNQQDGIYRYLKKLCLNADFLVYSYKGDNSDGSPQSYTCGYTFKDHISEYVARLKTQITDYLNNSKTAHNLDVYLVGHSLGGALSFALLANMELKGYIHTNGSKVVGVITLDSPLGGIPGLNGIYLAQLEAVYKKSCKDMVTQKSWSFTALNDLVSIFTYLTNQAYGATASIMHTLNGNAIDPSNEQIAEKAHDEQGITILTAGNPVDYVYDFRDCPFGTLFPYSQFLSTQWITDEPPNAIYGRYFPDNGPACSGFSQMIINHAVVLTKPSVKTAISQLLSGQIPSALLPKTDS